MSSRLTSQRADLVEALRALEAWGDARRWTGPDPYEGLNATRLVGPLRRSPLGRRALVQAVRRSPLDVRPLLGIRAEQDAATLALVASAYTRSNDLPDAEAKLACCLDDLERLRTRTVSEPAWGYHFDVQTRFFFYPRTQPNTIATAFAGQALLDAYQRTGDDSYLVRAEGVGDYFLRRVPQTPGRGGAYFGYLVGDRTPIHNANVLACALLARVGALTGRDDFCRAAAAGVGYTLAHQLTSGAWPYAEPASASWIDGYHTGYVLQALLVCRDSGIDIEAGALDRGLEHYWSALFLADGTPRATTEALYPIESICAAEGIATFARAGQLQRAWTVFEYACRRLRRADGAFAYRRERLLVHRIPYVRWVQAPMLLALTHLLWALDA